MNLPELPIMAPFGYIRDGGPDGHRVFQHAPFDEMTRLVCSTAPVYSFSQLRSFAEEAVRMEREAIAKMIDETWYWDTDRHEIAKAIRSRTAVPDKE